MPTIDMTPTWGEWGNIYRRFAESGECEAVRQLRADHARMCAAAQALRNVMDTFDGAQMAITSQTMADELAKAGY